MIVWALELVAFIWVAAIVRFLYNWANLLVSLFHYSLHLWVSGHQVFFRILHIYSHNFVLSDRQSSDWSFRAINGKILNLFIVDFKHWNFYFKLLILLLYFDPLKYLIASSWNNALNHLFFTLLAPKPIIL